jgi:long-chain acyl-CoA synthetase
LPSIYTNHKFGVTLLSDYESHLRPDRGIFPLTELAKRSANDFGPAVAMRIWAGDNYREVTFQQLSNMVSSIARWLVEQGLNLGDRVAVLGDNRPEWGATYLGILLAGGIVVPVDSLMPVTGIRHVLVDSESRFLFATHKFLRDISEMAPVSTLEKKIALDTGSNISTSSPNVDAIPFAELLAGRSAEGKSSPSRTLEDAAALLYTSGTTGHSKGVMLSHRNIISNVAAASRILPIGQGDTFLSVLPIHHAFECTAGFLLPIYTGCAITYARSMKSADLIADMRNTNVTIMIAVPLLYEKLMAGILRNVKKKGGLPRTLFHFLYGASLLGEKIGFDLGRSLFAGIREKAGMGTVRLFVSGGGPLDPSVADFFNRFGIRMLQGYGLTEASPVTNVNPPWRSRAVTVGPPMPGVEVRLAETNEQGVGEVLVKGGNVFIGYYNNEQATKEVKTEDGWLMTGDLGVIRTDGYLQIVGRKKNIIVTGGGKNVYPEEIEHHLNRQRFIAESLVLGAKRESGYGEEVVALIFPDYEQVDLFFEEQGKAYKATPEAVNNLIKADIETAQIELAEYKRIRRFRIQEEEFTKTSTRKIKRFLYKGEMVGVGKKGEGRDGEV